MTVLLPLDMKPNGSDEAVSSFFLNFKLIFPKVLLTSMILEKGIRKFSESTDNVYSFT